MSNKLKITRFEDPGHSWFSVKRSLLAELNILDKISGCSYQKGQSVYLEEDCDAGIFFKAYIKKEAITWNDIQDTFEIISSHTNNSSPVRSYQGFQA